MHDRPWLLDETVENIDGVATEGHKGAMKYRTELAHKRTRVDVCLVHSPNIYNKELVISLPVLEFLTLADPVQLPFTTHSVLKVFTFFQSICLQFLPWPGRLGWSNDVIHHFENFLTLFSTPLPPCSFTATTWQKPPPGSICLGAYHP